MKRIIAALLLTALLASCQAKPALKNSTDLSADVQATPVSTESVALDGNGAIAATDFAVRLFQKGAKPGENTLLSPISVLYALSMTANGAKGETRTQMENVLGKSVPELNSYLHAYMKSLPESEKYKLKIANAIWFMDGFAVNQDFLKTNADYYGADIYQAPFDDSTLKDINNWVENKTDGMIKDILDGINPDSVMYLVNALAFDAEWQRIYEEDQIRNGTFTKENGEKQNIELMYSTERQYLKDERASGFIKYYADSKYAFVALLPDEGVTVDEYVASMSGEKLAAMLSAPQDIKVHAAIPKFESDYNTGMSKVLSDMGMPDAFGPAADFTGLGAGHLYISRVIHKTHIAVDERGTKAGAATVVEMSYNSAAVDDVEEVILDRPFVYMLIDCEAKLPLFIGTMTEIN